MTASDIPCPACDEPVPPGAPACPACGIRLVGQDAARLWEVNQQIAVLSREAESLLASMRVPAPASPVPAPGAPGMPGTPGTPGGAAHPGPWQPTAYPVAPQPYPVAPHRSAGQQLLLGFGALLLLSAVSVFALVAWSLIGIAGQALILTCVTVGAAVSSRAASTHRLPAAAHTAAVIAVGVSALMALGAWSLGLAGADDLAFTTFVALAGPVLALVWLGYDALTARVWSVTGATSVYLPSAVLALGAAGAAAVDAAGPGDVLRGVGLLAVAGALVTLAAVVRRVLDARRGRLPSVTGLVLALVVAAGAVLLLLATTYDLDRGLVDRYGAALALLVLGGVLLTVPVRVLTGTTVPAGSAPAAPAPATAPGRVTAASASRLAGAALGVLAAGSVLLDVPDLGWAALSVVSSVVLVVLALRSARAVLVWSAGLLAPGAAAVVVSTVEGGARTLADLLRGDVVEPWVPVALEIALPALWAAACAVHLVRALVAQPSVTMADSAGAPVVAPAAAGVVLGGTVAQLLGVSHGTWEWTVPIGLAWTVAALLLARAASVRTTQDPQPGWSSVHAAALLAAGYAVVPPLQLLVEGADGRVQAAGCWVVAAAVAWYASAPGRLEAGYVAAALVSVGNGLLVWELGGDQVELYTLPAAAAFAVLGVAQHRVARAADPGRHPSTMLTSAPALAVALVPSLLVAVTGDEVLRLLLVVLAGMALLVLGVARALQAPVLLGALTLGLVALVQGSPFLAFVPAWVLLASAGAALLAIGVLWESALARGRQLGRWVHGLH
ncbi:zinc ribbon domain-containing protein [Nocardioides sp.]|uniref:zinc ribbon domain-containing protein n=1 Tax=Nocardioides sp. TaxID=35761 RepID=UPI002603E2D2|nr:zinc ribbon domain-containing protein [Nocardioides sp.]